MTTKEFAKKIIKLKNLHDIPFEIEIYFNDIKYLFLKKDSDVTRPSEEKKEEILKTFFQYFPKIEQKEIQFVRAYKNLNYIYYSKFENQNNIVLFNKEIILIRKQNFLKSYDYNFLPIKKDIHLKYEFYQNNPHLNIDQKIKLNTPPEYKKINHLIYILQKIIRFCRTENYYYINHKPYENMLHKVYALVLLNETEPMNFIKNDIDVIKARINSDALNFEDVEEFFKLIES